MLVLRGFFDFGEAAVDVGEVVAEVGVDELVGLAVLVVFVLYFWRNLRFRYEKDFVF